MNKTTLLVPSISCNVCANKISDALKGMNGIESVAVDIVGKTVDVTHDEKIVTDSQIRSEVQSLGYEVQ